MNRSILKGILGLVSAVSISFLAASCGMTDSTGKINGADTVITKDSNGVIDTSITTDKGTIITAAETRNILMTPNGDSETVVSANDTILMGSIRKEITDKDVILSTFKVKDIYLSVDTSHADTVFANSNLPVPLTVKLYIVDPSVSATPVLGMWSPSLLSSNPAKVSNLLAGDLHENNGLYLDSAGNAMFLNMISDTTKDTVIVSTTMTFAQKLLVPANFHLAFKMVGEGKKKI